MAECPHCRQTIEPPPKRSRKCPYCRRRIELRRGQLLTPEAAEEQDAKITAAEAKQRFREGRQRVADEIREAKKSGVVAGFKPLVSANDCRTCKAVRNKFFPIATCTPEMLPPYENCEIPEGCRATFTTTLLQEYEKLLSKTSPRAIRNSGVAASSKSKSGCLSALAALCALISVILWVAITRVT
jgi:hypothetical protein